MASVVDDEILEAVAKDGSMVSSLWPALLERILPRLDHIVHNDFLIPSIPLPGALPPRLKDQEVPIKPEQSSSQESSSQSSQSANKENAPPPRSPPSRPPVPPFSATTTPTQRIPDSQPSSVPTPDGALPPQLLSMLSFIQQTLRTSFSTSPPHTIQRFAELILHPRDHYRTLPSYLRALDRVVTVSSGTDIFPLPDILLPNTSLAENTNGALLNGTSNFNLGSDESLGGALLTPIPWLRDNATGEVRIVSTAATSGLDGTSSTQTASISINGTSSASPQREAGAVTQGELLRQEQEAGVVPVAQTTSPQGRQTRSATAATARAMAEGEGGVEELEHPHARGPDVVGIEDMGPQERGAARGGFDVEAALGRSVSKVDNQEEGGKEEERKLGKEAEDDNEDVVIADADGKTEDDLEKAGASGENVGPDAVDTTAL
ncbi:MAG: hypothetical protein M1830_009362 [Pleopsidium flavum]|nr:MAG: hypothetical protein M1830_009362 [Pleopsidium flavum]